MAGPQPIFTAFPFPRFSRGTTGTKFLKEQLRTRKLAPPWLAVKRSLCARAIQTVEKEGTPQTAVADGLVRRGAGFFAKGGPAVRPAFGAYWERTLSAIPFRLTRNGSRPFPHFGPGQAMRVWSVAWGQREVKAREGEPDPALRDAGGHVMKMVDAVKMPQLRNAEILPQPQA